MPTDPNIVAIEQLDRKIAARSKALIASQGKSIRHLIASAKTKAKYTNDERMAQMLATIHELDDLCLRYGVKVTN